MSTGHVIGSPVIELCSGDMLDLSNPDPEVITNEVIAHHLSNVCRYAGAVRRPYSVAEHTLLVAAWLEHKGFPPAIILSGLHHDDSEAFIGDVTRPLKELLSDYRELEKKFTFVVAEALDYKKLGLRVESQYVKQADHWAMAAEAYYLMPTRGREWWSWGIFSSEDEVAKLPEIQRLRLSNGLPHTIIRNLWIHRHMELTIRIQRDYDKLMKAASE